MIVKILKNQLMLVRACLYIKSNEYDTKDMFKLENTNHMKKRLRVYNTGNANNIEPLFIIKVDDIDMV